jgi:hypothetical protein
MTSYFSMTIGQHEQLDRLLAQEGMTAEDVKKILAYPYLAGKMVRALHDVVQSVSPRQQVEQQLITWKDLGLFVSDKKWDLILQQADVFEPATDTDEPLVTGGFGWTHLTAVANKLFGAFMPPNGYTKFNYIKDTELRYVSDMKPSGGVHLVHYDPNAYAGLSPEAALKAAQADKLRLAGIEVLEYLMLEPKTGLTWDGKLHYFPNLSGLQLKYGSGWSLVPGFRRIGLELVLSAIDAGHAFPDWSSPVVREC